MASADSDSNSTVSRSTWIFVAIALVIVVVLAVVYVVTPWGDAPEPDDVGQSAAATQGEEVDPGDSDSILPTATATSSSSAAPAGTSQTVYFSAGNEQDWRVFAININGAEVTAEERYGPAGNDGGGCFVGEVADGEYAGVLIADVGQQVTIPFKLKDGQIRLKGKWRDLSPATEAQVDQLTTSAEQGPIDLTRCAEYRDLLASGELQVID